MDNVREDLEERDIQLSTSCGKTKNIKVWRNINKGLIVSKLMDMRRRDFIKWIKIDELLF